MTAHLGEIECEQKKGKPAGHLKKRSSSSKIVPFSSITLSRRRRLIVSSHWSKTNPIAKKARRGFRGYPIATVAFYGPDDRTATKVAVGIVRDEGADADPMRRWHRTELDIRRDDTITQEILAFIRQHRVATVTATEKILGCPHEEGVDYPEGSECPECTYWVGRDRWEGVL